MKPTYFYRIVPPPAQAIYQVLTDILEGKQPGPLKLTRFGAERVAYEVLRMPILTIEPIARIEGHARIALQLSDAGEAEQAKFHITQLRGFEKFCEGRPFPEMPERPSKPARALAFASRALIVADHELMVMALCRLWGYAALQRDCAAQAMVCDSHDRYER